MEMLNNRVYRYLIQFLLGKYTCLERVITKRRGIEDLIVYTDKPEEVKRPAIVIYRSEFLSFDVYGTERSIPKLPLNEWRGIPILFGEGREEWINDGKTLVIYADIIASAFYMLSRYEEMYYRDKRDKYGRFPAKYSLPVRAGFIDRPIVDEYSEALRQIIRENGFDRRFNIRLDKAKTTFSRVNLSHDIDQPYQYNGFRSFLRATLKENISPLTAFKLSFLNQSHDAFNTFGDILIKNKALIKALPEKVGRTIFFVKTKAPHQLDKPNYSLRSPYIKKILNLGQGYNVVMGLHTSFYAGLNPDFIINQKKVLDQYFKQNTTISRHHYLSQREPEDLIALYEAGIKHDYTMGYVEVAGFRLGTCRPVRFINPNTRYLWEITMHPLTIMDVSLSRKDFMNLDYSEAEAYAHRLIREVARHGGELNLLWHNEQFAQCVSPWQGKLYDSILNLIKELCPNEELKEG